MKNSCLDNLQMSNYLKSINRKHIKIKELLGNINKSISAAFKGEVK
jgi:hypothetical protein